MSTWTLIALAVQFCIIGALCVAWLMARVDADHLQRDLDRHRRARADLQRALAERDAPKEQNVQPRSAEVLTFRGCVRLVP